MPGLPAVSASALLALLGPYVLSDPYVLSGLYALFSLLALLALLALLIEACHHPFEKAVDPAPLVAHLLKAVRFPLLHQLLPLLHLPELLLSLGRLARSQCQ